MCDTNAGKLNTRLLNLRHCLRWCAFLGRIRAAVFGGVTTELGQVSRKFASAKNGQVSRNISAAEHGKISRKVAAAKIGQVSRKFVAEIKTVVSRKVAVHSEKLSS